MVTIPKPPKQKKKSKAKSIVAQARLHPDENKDAFDIWQAWLSQGWTPRQVIEKALHALQREIDEGFVPTPPELVMKRGLLTVINKVIALRDILDTIDFNNASVQDRTRVNTAFDEVNDAVNTSGLAGDLYFTTDE